MKNALNSTALCKCKEQFGQPQNVPTNCLLSAEGMRLSKTQHDKQHTFQGFESNSKSLGLSGL